MKALYIHGLHSSGNSETAENLKKILPQYEWITPDFDLLKPLKTVDEINEIMVREHSTLVVGSSLGGFYCLYTKGGPLKIVINPCMEVGEEMTEDLAAQINQVYCGHDSDLEERNATYGIFNADDEFLKNKIWFDKEWHCKHAGVDNSCIVPGHQIESYEELEASVRRAMTWLSGDENRIKMNK